MVLDNLGDSLKRTIKKIANAVHVDAQLVKEVVRDIQRALLQSDVNVKLVLELSKKIEQRALEEKPPSGMTNREHVIHIVYDELVRIVGASRELAIRKQVIMMVGLYGQGKCVHGDSMIALGSGDIVTAEQLYEHYAAIRRAEQTEDGTIIDVSNDDLVVPSFNPSVFTMEPKKVTHLWRLNGKSLLEISLDAGNDCSVKVTPEHPFFVLRNGKFLQLRADELQPQDYIAVPREYHVVKDKQYDLLTDLRQLDLDIFLPAAVAKSYMTTHFPSMKTALAQLNTKRNYCKFTSYVKKGRIPLRYLDDTTCPRDSLRIKHYPARKSIRFPRFLTPDLAEFVGYCIGDGHLTRGYLEITSADKEIIERINHLGKDLFNLTAGIRKDKRSNAYRIVFSSTTLSMIFARVFGFPQGRKSAIIKIPPCILKGSNNVLSRFLRAYFDCDGSVCRNYRLVELTSKSETIVKQVNLLLRRFGIFSGVSVKKIHAQRYWKLMIEARYTESFAEAIGSLIKRKQARLAAFSRMGSFQGCGKHDMIPLGCVLQNLRDVQGMSRGEIQTAVRSYGIYEKRGRISREALTKLCAFYLAEHKGDLLDILHLVKNKQNLFDRYPCGKVNAVLYFFTSQNILEKTHDHLLITGQGEDFITNADNYNAEQTLQFLQHLASSDACWIQLRQIQPTECPRYVYDFTVEDNHSFIANGIVVHNTTSCGKLATYFKRKGLRPALIAGDVHRPAAYEQLKQISEQVEVLFYGDKNEKNAVNVIKEGLNKFKRTADVIIVDTSGRHKLEADLISEMKNIFKAIKPDEKLLVMDAAMGQQAGPQARAFNDAIGITGIVLTKLDGTAKGGGALSAAAEVGAPIVFVGTGEHSADFEKFDPSGFISRLLGMGDIKSLLERAEESLKGKDAEKTARKLMSGKFNLNDMYEQMNMISGMGPLSKIAEMLPGGMSGKLKNVDMDETQNKLKKFRIIMDSMTNEEREDPELIQASRIKRIARGAGVENKDVKEVLKYYNMTKRMMKGFSSDRKMRRNLMRQLDFGK
ncbi:MAG: signal recognition particle receptor subunit alpha [Thermoplasmata archaeon]|nr:signal recognition particle receptor subunit alpha [Thermoplasmata archaeon]